MSQASSLSLVKLTALVALVQSAAASNCIEPGKCTPPATKYSNVLAGITPRQQWNINGGFCGAMSIQTAHLTFGAWISQDLVRKGNNHGTGHCGAGVGCEVDPTNVGETALNLKLDYEEWDYNSTKPQSARYKQWMKAHLAVGHPIVWFVMCKGDDACPYPNACPNGGAFGHVEPVWGVFSNHPLNDTTVYDDDWVVHSSDQDLNPYYRLFSSLEDTTAMNGNCAKAQPGFGKNEMYPCINDQTDYGIAINGIKGAGLPVSLSVNNQQEPDTRMGQLPTPVLGVVTATSLTPGKRYTLYRYEGTATLPTDGTPGSTAKHTVPFTASTPTWVYNDKVPFLSNTATYYRVFLSSS
eukprot:m.137984 g.137984  ORF g.137984 m.137984 type:complete len:353 (-) comp29965_c0_seq1:60-1118(-)